MSIIGKGDAKEGWEKSDFPILCETCLGPNPYVRMMKAEFDKECKICARPFTVFRWKPGADARFKKTEICQTCAKVKNVCQTCLLDLEFGLPVQVRDAAAGSVPQSDVMREWQAMENERKLASGKLEYQTTSGREELRNQMLKLARNAPYFTRNQPHVCSFFVKGQCNRGDACPYRHEIPENKDKELANQNIKDRYYGVNDPVAKKLMNKIGIKSLEPPADPEIKTLFIGNVPSSMTEDDLRDKFYSYGEIQEVKLVPKSFCAFITYTTRQAAEAAASKLYNNLSINGHPLKLMWSKRESNSNVSKQPQQHTQSTTTGPSYPTAPSVNPFAPNITQPHYASMNPNQFGTKRDR